MAAARPRGRALVPRRRALQALADSTLIARVLDLSDETGLELSLEQLQRELSFDLLLQTHARQRAERGPRLSAKEIERLKCLVELLRRLRSTGPRPTRIRCTEDVLSWAEPRLVHLEHEELWLLCLDGRHALTVAERVAQGGLHGCGVTPRDVLRPAVRNGAAAVVIVHNHPSGDPTPSLEDVTMTEQLGQACAVLGLPLLDHVVVARGGARSAFAALR